jgi:hypothetical protein
MPGLEIVVDKVKYEARAPWPGIAARAGSGSSLQLLDASQDNARVSNWSDGAGWRFAFLTGFLQTNSTNIILFSSGSAGEVYLDDITLVAGSVPAAGPNLLDNGDFESPLSGPWSFVGHQPHQFSHRHQRRPHRSSSLRLLSTLTGSQTQCLRQGLNPPAESNQFTISFWFLSSTNGTNVQIRSISGAGITLNVNFRPPAPVTPGTNNSVTAPVPAFPLVWLNEVLPVNTNGLRDAQNEREPWLELFNSGFSPVPLDTYALSDNYLNLNPWAFPTGAVINPGEFKVIFADGETNETTPAEWHTSFRLASGTGSLALLQNPGSGLRIVDYFNYDNLPANSGYGSCPDGQLFERLPCSMSRPARPTIARPRRSLSPSTNGWSQTPASSAIRLTMTPTTGSNCSIPTPCRWTWAAITSVIPSRTSLSIGCPPTAITSSRLPAISSSGPTARPGRTRPTAPTCTRTSSSAPRARPSPCPRPTARCLIRSVFTNQMDNISEGRYPDGTGPIFTLPTPTPRGANSNPGSSEPPEILQITYDAGAVTVTVATVAGRTYRLEYKNELSDPMWIPIVPNQTASGLVTTFLDNAGGASQRFYQAVLLP